MADGGWRMALTVGDEAQRHSAVARHRQFEDERVWTLGGGPIVQRDVQLQTARQTGAVIALCTAGAKCRPRHAVCRDLVTRSLGRCPHRTSRPQALDLLRAHVRVKA